MKNPFKKKNSTAKENIKNIATLTSGALVARANECTSVDQYIATVRLPLNQAIVEAMLGCKIDRGEKKVKFGKKLPNTEQIAEVARMVDSFIQVTELPTLKRIATLEQQVQNPAPQQQSDDMAMPADPAEIGTVNISFQGMPQRVQLMEKPTEKKLKKQVFSAFLGGFMLNGTDCVTLASMGEKARSTANRNKMLVVGGIVILITGLTVAGVIFYRSKHKKSGSGETAEVEIDGESVDIDIPASDTITDEVDAPQVEIE